MYDPHDGHPALPNREERPAAPIVAKQQLGSGYPVLPRSELGKDTRRETQRVSLSQLIDEGGVIPDAVEHLLARVKIERAVREQELLGGHNPKSLVGRKRENAQQIIETVGLSFV